MRQDFVYTYNKIGYQVLEVSATERIGLEQLNEMLSDKVSLFTGNSGVGKSTLIGSLIPGFTPRTGEISDVNNRGKHTTTFSEMYPLSGGGYLVDTFCCPRGEAESVVVSNSTILPGLCILYIHSKKASELIKLIK